ncbi:MAG: PleD family two-component system response regulator [Candidatus Cryptobacteroides sp.]
MNSNNQPVILVVDDISTNNILMKNLLRVRNYEVLLAQSGIEALKIAEERKPDVILLDIMMPVMDGYEVLARLRSNEATKDIKVVMVSALGGKIDIKNAMDLGADGYITKPVVVQKLYDLLDKFTN